MGWFHVVQRAIDGLPDAHHDVLVVGGGIHGVQAARAAARRGLKVALAEAQDLGAGTSSRSTMLAHGGLRYLAQFDVGLVKEALQERGILTRMAPHLVQPLPFVLPFYKGAPYPKWQMKLGIRWYSWLARGSGYPKHTFLSREKVLALEPSLSPKGLKGGALYYDGQIQSPERLLTELAVDADAHGARVANHAAVVELTEAQEKVTGAVVKDRFTGEEVEVQATTVLNTTGPFLDHALTGWGAQDDLLRLTKGIHLFTPRFTDHALVVNAEDGRTFFAIPWQDHQLIGTTDTDYTDDPRTVHATTEDVSYLQDATRRFFPEAPLDQVRFTNAGLRNLLNVEGVHPSQVTRRPEIRDHSAEGLGGLFSLAGGKWTTARATGHELVEAARDHLGPDLAPRPEPEPLPIGHLDPEAHRARARDQAKAHGLHPEVGDRLVTLYGTRWSRILQAGAEPLCEHGALLAGEVTGAAEREMAWTVEDVLRRRTLGWVCHPCQGTDAAPAVADLLAEAGVPEEVARPSIQGWQESVDLHQRWRR